MISRWLDRNDKCVSLSMDILMVSSPLNADVISPSINIAFKAEVLNYDNRVKNT